jgi:molybdopterin converting factor subunit 1
VRVTVRLFARLREIAGTGELILDLAAPATIRAVWAELASRYDELAPYAASVSAARNLEYARMDTAVSDGDEIAFLPPVSGGAGAQRRPSE